MNSQLQPFLFQGDQFLKTTLFRVGGTSISPLWFLKLAVAFLAVFLLSILLKRFLKHRLLRQMRMSQGHGEALSTLLSYGAGTLGLVLVLQASGLNLAPLAVTAGGLGIGVGFGLQETTKNLVSGLTLLFEGKLQVDDYVEFNGLSGYIKEISIRSTIIRTFDGSDVVVPNSNLTSNQVLNWSYKSLEGRLRLPIRVAYDSEPILVTETLLNSAYTESRVLHNPPPKVIFKGFGESSMEFELWVWVAQIDEGVFVRSSLNFIIEHNLRQMGLKIPFPQRDLWLRNVDALNFETSSSKAFERSAKGQATDNQQGLEPDQRIAKSSRQTISVRGALRQLPHFKASSDLFLREVIETGYRKFLAESEVLFKGGEMGSDFYLILSGSVETVVTQLDRTVKVYHRGDLFGEVAVMLNLPYTSTARALENTSLFVIHKTSFEKLLRLHPDLAEAFTDELTKETEIYQGVRQQLQDLGLLSMTEPRPQFAVWMQARLRNLFFARSPIA